MKQVMKAEVVKNKRGHIEVLIRKKINGEWKNEYLLNLEKDNEGSYFLEIISKPGETKRIWLV